MDEVVTIFDKMGTVVVEIFNFFTHIVNIA